MQAQSAKPASFLLALFMLPTLVITKALCVSINSVEVPAAVMNSSQVTLICNYELQGDQLYTVKWYKNYVEFYRFQPPASGAEPAATQADTDSRQPDNGANSKHGFVWDGINLNLSKSNATHVYLHQVSLASEGTYKCEVTADTPTFPTVTAERQMKVYVLPKQKLTIVNNSPSKLSALAEGANPTVNSEYRHQPSPAPLKQTPLVYNVNDTVNLTCISGPSKPPAKLSWLLNDTPVAPTSKWIQHHQHQATSDQLAGSKSTLAFRIQPSLLRQQRTDPHSSRFQSLQVRCVARLGSEYLSETSIQASGGKIFVKKRQQQVASPSLPSPFSLRSSGQRGTEPAAFPSTSSHVDHSVYRWPRPASQQRPLSGWRRNGANHDSASNDAWISMPTGGTEPTALSADHQSQDEHSRRYVAPMHHGTMIWASQQLKDQAEYISSMLKLTRPNELDSPVIEVGMHDKPDESSSTNEDTDTDAAYSKTLSQAEKYEPPNSMIKDYELNDLVRFTCQPRFAGRLSADVHEPGVNIRVKWFINNKEINTTHHINSFDGSMFYYARDPHKLTNRPSASNQSSSKFLATSDTLLAISNESNTTSASPTTDQSLDQSSILVEFTPTLFQLKELDLKCHTVIEQTFIEYDINFDVSAPASQVDQDRFRGLSPKYRDPEHRNSGRVYLNNNSKRQDKNKLSPTLRVTQSNSVVLAPCLVVLLVNCFLAQLFVYRLH